MNECSCSKTAYCMGSPDGSHCANAKGDRCQFCGAAMLRLGAAA